MTLSWYDERLWENTALSYHVCRCSGKGINIEWKFSPLTLAAPKSMMNSSFISREEAYIFRIWVEQKERLHTSVRLKRSLLQKQGLILLQDTEGTFRPERIQQIAERFGSIHPNLLPPRTQLILPSRSGHSASKCRVRALQQQRTTAWTPWKTWWIVH